MSLFAANNAADQTFASIQEKIVTILQDPSLSAEVPTTTKEFTFQFVGKVNALGGITKYCESLVKGLNLQFVEQKVFNTVEESRIDYCFVHKPIGVVPLTGVLYHGALSTVAWNSELEAPVIGTDLPSSSLSLKLSYYADAEGWSLSDVEPVISIV